MQIAAVGRAFPRHYVGQPEITQMLSTLWSDSKYNPRQLERVHKNVLVGGRHTALPLTAYAGLKNNFTAANDAFIASAVELGEQAIQEALKAAHLQPTDIDHLFFVSVTGLATPSVDARLSNRMGLRSDMKRTPIFGLGCVAGAAGIARAADYVRAFPKQVAVLLSVELCSLTMQQEDISMANVIASGLFGDGAAAAIVVGAERSASGPRVLGTRSVFYPNTEGVMGWNIGSSGFRIVLSAGVPQMVLKHIAHDVESFLTEHGLHRSDIKSFVCHPGGPKVLDAFDEALNLPPNALAITRKSLAEVGNLSSASVLMVLRETMAEDRPAAGTLGLMLAMGPGFCSELVLLKW